MSVIPPNWLGSIIQSQGSAQRSGERKAHEAASQAEANDPGTFSEKLQNVIDNGDRDGQVYSDAEGQGSQGRPPERDPAGLDPDDESSASEGGGLDVQA